MNRSTSSSATSGPRSLISVCSPVVGSITARLVRDSPAIRVNAVEHRLLARAARGSACPVAPPAIPVAITGRPSRRSARATLTPLPPAIVRASTARWRWPRRKFGTATVRSIAALRVTVRITRRDGCTRQSPTAGARTRPRHPRQPLSSDRRERRCRSRARCADQAAPERRSRAPRRPVAVPGARRRSARAGRGRGRAGSRPAAPGPGLAVDVTTIWPRGAGRG